MDDRDRERIESFRAQSAKLNFISAKLHELVDELLRDHSWCIAEGLSPSLNVTLEPKDGGPALKLTVSIEVSDGGV